MGAASLDTHVAAGGAPRGALWARRGAAESPRVRILHLEDSASDSDLAQEHLEAEGIACDLRRVETREDFEEALGRDEIDLILADFQLPAFDGVTAFLLARQLCPEVPFVILTGKLGEEYAIDALDLGVADYVHKQSFAQLAPAVHRALLRRRERTRCRDAEEQLRLLRQRLEQLVLERTAEATERASRLAAANRELETFVASLAHDLRNPLVAVAGFSRRLEQRCAGRIDEPDVELLRRVIAATGRMERLLDDLLTFFRNPLAGSGRVRIDMEAVVREAFERLLPLPGRQVRLEVAPLPRAYGHRAMVRQVLVNLLANAVTYTAAQAEPLVEVSGWEEADATGYCVRDNGVGFDMSLRGRLFEPFQRLHDAAEYPGTGVGLATVRQIVARHGGRVWASGTPGDGATFCFTLPKSAGWLGT